jgi:pimeloyl-ACP methyl ester carboxylesterase
MMRPMADLVVLSPGITRSVPRDTRGRDLWTPTALTAQALVAPGRGIADLELYDEDAADDGITAPRVSLGLHLIPGLWKINGCSKMSRYLQRQFAFTPARNFFAYPYDWRQDKRVAARRLKERTDRWLSEWGQKSPDARLILVGHSMGGLVARCFWEFLGGWRDTRRLVTFGTAHGGLFASVHQLLPIDPCLDADDGGLIRVSKTARLPGVDAERPVAFRFRGAEPMASLTALITSLVSGAEIARPVLGTTHGWRRAEMAPPGPGTYRRTTARDGVEPATDNFMIGGRKEPTTVGGVIGGCGPRARGRQSSVAFLVQFVVVWLGVWVVANGPMRVPFIRWRFRGGRLA